jgi:hypothetical protein
MQRLVAMSQSTVAQRRAAGGMCGLLLHGSLALAAAHEPGQHGEAIPDPRPERPPHTSIGSIAVYRAVGRNVKDREQHHQSEREHGR